MIVTVANQKGGAGKTTLTTGLAAAWLSQGLRVLVVDADPQGTARKWASVAAELGHAAPEVIGLEDGRLIVRQIPEKAPFYDRIVIDTPPRISKIQRGAMLVADVVLIPGSAGGFEAWAMEPTLEVLEEVRAGRPDDFLAAVVLNRVTMTRLASAAREDLRADTGLPVLESELGNRVVFNEATTAGVTAIEYEPLGKAAAELRAVAAEIDRLVGVEGKKGRKRAAA